MLQLAARDRQGLRRSNELATFSRCQVSRRSSMYCYGEHPSCPDILATQSIDFLEEDFAGAFHTAEVLVIASFNGFKRRIKDLAPLALALFGLHEVNEDALSPD
jgi:hypothetical protein